MPTKPVLEVAVVATIDPTLARLDALIADTQRKEAAFQETVQTMVQEADAAAKVIPVLIEMAPPASSGPAGPALTPADDAILDRAKFDAVYAAGVAMTMSQTNGQRLAKESMIKFSTEGHIAARKATTKAEQALASKYAMAIVNYELAAAQAVLQSSSVWKPTFDQAVAAHNDADRIYLGKK